MQMIIKNVSKYYKLQKYVISNVSAFSFQMRKKSFDDFWKKSIDLKKSLLICRRKYCL